MDDLTKVGTLSFKEYQELAMRSANSEILGNIGEEDSRLIYAVMSKAVELGKVLGLVKKAYLHNKQSINKQELIAAHSGGVPNPEVLPTYFDQQATDMIASAIGGMDEAAEFAWVVLEVLWGNNPVSGRPYVKPFDDVDILKLLDEENGDRLWYAALGAKATGSKLVVIAWLNLMKLATRHKKKDGGVAFSNDYQGQEQ